MAIIENVELWWAKVDAERPVKGQADESDRWEVQLRTTDKALATKWAKENVKFKPLKRVVKDAMGEPQTDEFGEPLKEVIIADNGKPYFAVKVSKKTRKADGSAQQPVKVVLGDLSDLDPSKIGNGSIGNVRVFQYDYNYKGKEGVANMLMAIQITTLNEYVSQSSEDSFTMVKTKINKAGDNAPQSSQDEIDDEIPF